jgi:uncharacterized membrane protein YcaP (DUF421 family)
MPATVTAFIAGVALSTLAIYVFLILMIRLVGRRMMAQLSAIDFVVIILLGSAVETAMVGASTSLVAGLVAASVLLVSNRLLTMVMVRSKRLRHLVTGGPVLLVHGGRILQTRVRRLGFTEADVLEALRERGVHDLADVSFAVLETDGRINVVRRAPAEGHPSGGAAAHAPGDSPDPRSPKGGPNARGRPDAP